MRIELREVTKGARARILAPTSAVVSSGEAVLVQAETEQRPTVLGLIASGRMRPDSGAVLVEDGDRLSGAAARRRLRRTSALVDAPTVSEPDRDVLAVGVVTEELMFAGRPANPITARRWMHEHGFEDLVGVPIGQVEPSRRIRMLCELAASRPGVRALVLVAPDRHGGRPRIWWRIAEELAGRGLAVLVIAGRASWEVLHGEGPDPAPAEVPASDHAELPAQVPTQIPPQRPAADSASRSHPLAGSPGSPESHEPLESSEGSAA
ncbi:hypothetical protein MUN78_13995 [Leucobacter allii]|uniref:ABC transporter ATP-binding protein n=1 Tax=Leucobacter allii TaxID=2932247 RepID=A0ABY4FJA4_9MICO|nr:hypothetical protein [Leucobacter allii]UOQ56767.1 hypothetical protein MUN78_13995 [Leucobacter allii]